MVQAPHLQQIKGGTPEIAAAHLPITLSQTPLVYSFWPLPRRWSGNELPLSLVFSQCESLAVEASF
jgi:hypothetical protein